MGEGVRGLGRGQGSALVEDLAEPGSRGCRLLVLLACAPSTPVPFCAVPAVSR